MARFTFLQAKKVKTVNTATKASTGQGEGALASWPCPGSRLTRLGRPWRGSSCPGSCGAGVPGHDGAGVRVVAVQLRHVLADDWCAAGPA